MDSIIARKGAGGASFSTTTKRFNTISGAGTGYIDTAFIFGRVEPGVYIAELQAAFNFESAYPPETPIACLTIAPSPYDASLPYDPDTNLPLDPWQCRRYPTVFEGGNNGRFPSICCTGLLVVPENANNVMLIANYQYTRSTNISGQITLMKIG